MYYICYPFGILMRWCWDLVGNYGLSIIMFAVLTRIIMLPLSVWVHKNSIKLVKIQPEVNFLKVRFFGDRERIMEEENKLHKREKYNPLLSIIPLVIQIILLFAVLYIIKEPLTYILNIPNDVCKTLAEAVGPNVNYMDDQLAVIRAVQDGTVNASAYAGNEAVLSAINAINGFSLDFIGIRLDAVTTQVWGWYILVPFAAAISAYFMCFVQNAVNVVQMEQGKFNKYGLMALSVGLSLFLGFIAYTGVVLYWVCGNILAIIQQFLLNAAINPKKHVDFDELQKSREELKKIQQLGEDGKDKDRKANAKREKADYKRFFKVVNKHLVIWSERSGFYKYYEALIDGLLRRSNVVIHYVTNDPNDAIFKKAEEEPRIRPYYIGQKKLITLMMRMDADVVVMTTPDLQSQYIKRSLLRKDVEYIYVPHDMMSVHMGFRKGALDHFDTVFCTGPHVVREIRAQEKKYGLPEKNLVQFGYPLTEKLEASYEAQPKEEHKIKEILIAPSWQEDNLLDSCVDTLIEKLLSDRYHLTVRPHPEYSKRYQEKLRALTEKYKDVPEDRLSFELDFTTNKSIYSSDLLITDWSGIAYEFAFATKKPVLFVNTKMKVENPDWEEIGETPSEIYLRPQIGHALEKSELEEKVADAAADLIDRSAEYHDRINELKLSHLFCYGTGGSEGVKYILTRLSEIQKQKKEKT